MNVNKLTSIGFMCKSFVWTSTYQIKVWANTFLRFGETIKNCMPLPLKANIMQSTNFHVCFFYWNPKSCQFWIKCFSQCFGNMSKLYFVIMKRFDFSLRALQLEMQDMKIPTLNINCNQVLLTLINQTKFLARVSWCNVGPRLVCHTN